jgi:hypothetical protein
MAESYIVRKSTGGVKILESLTGNYNAPRTSYVSIPMYQGQYGASVSDVWSLKNTVYTISQALGTRFMQTWRIENGQLQQTSNEGTSSAQYGGEPFYADNTYYYTQAHPVLTRWTMTSGYPSYSSQTTNMQSYSGFAQAFGGSPAFADNDFLYGAVYGNNAGIVKYHRNNMAYNTHRLIILTYSSNYSVAVFPFASDTNYLYAYQYDSNNDFNNIILKLHKSNLQEVSRLSIRNTIGLTTPSVDGAQIVNNTLYALLKQSNTIYRFDISGTNLAYINSVNIDAAGTARGMAYDGNYIYTSVSGRLYTLNKDNLSTINGALIHSSFNLTIRTNTGAYLPWSEQKYIPYKNSMVQSGVAISQLELKQFSFNNTNYIAIPK